jgi:hypothetical protein
LLPIEFDSRHQGGIVGATFKPAVRWLLPFGLTTLLLAAGCSFIGVDQPSTREQTGFGAQDHVRLCAYLDDGVAQADVDAMVGSWNEDEGRLYGLDFDVVSYQQLSRGDAFESSRILAEIERESLPDSCDRQMFFVHRNAADFAWGLLLPEYLGAVDAHTGSHGWVAVNIVSVNQLVKPPSSVTQHEFYHLLGCEHFAMTECYARIAQLKLTAASLRAAGTFTVFPSYDMTTNTMITSRLMLQYLDRNEAGIPPPPPSIGVAEEDSSLANSHR